MSLKIQNVILAISVLMFGCSSVQRPGVSAPNVYNADAGSIPVIDHDAYNIVLPATEDVAINLPITDGAGPNGELLISLRRSQPAPFNGVLLNGPAVARISVEFRGQAARCMVDRQADIDRMRAMAIRDLGLLNSSLIYNREAYTLMLQSRDREINRLYGYIQQTSNPPVNFWPYVGIGLGGLVIGAVAATAIYFSVH